MALLPDLMKSSPPKRQDQAGDAISNLVNAITKGGVLDAVAPYLCSARLHAGDKKDGGIHLIAVGNIIRRLS